MAEQKFTLQRICVFILNQTVWRFRLQFTSPAVQQQLPSDLLGHFAMSPLIWPSDLLLSIEWWRPTDQLPGTALLSGGHQADQYAAAIGWKRRPNPAHRDGSHTRQVKPLLLQTHFRQLLLGTLLPLANSHPCLRQGRVGHGGVRSPESRCQFWFLSWASQSLSQSKLNRLPRHLPTPPT